MYVFIFRHISHDTNRIEKMVGVQWVLDSLKMFELYMADFYNALQTGKVR